jgi:uncharacterized alkaline shock family protein YloU
MKVYALIGPSGTGKSYKAVNVAGQKNVDYIIDDGLLIQSNKIIAGASAKKEPTKIAAIRRAVFMDPKHAAEVKAAIDAGKPNGILILGTSEEMINRIVQNLELPPIQEMIYISDISSPMEIYTARKIRAEEGKHVIPVPTFEVKKDFSGYFIDSVKSLIFRGRRPHITEKTIVRPTYSYRGRYTISDKAVVDIAIYNCINIPGINSIPNAAVEINGEGVIINVDVIMEYGFNMRSVLKEAQSRINKDVEYLTGLNVLQVNILARSVAI